MRTVTYSRNEGNNDGRNSPRCQNLVWQLCAATGKLPRQKGKLMRFATAPKDLQLSEWRSLTSWPCDGAPHSLHCLNCLN